MTITPEQIQLLIEALNAIASGLRMIASAISAFGTIALLFLFFKKMG